MSTTPERPRSSFVTKADLGEPKQMAAQLEAAEKLAHFDDVIVTSATEGFNVDAFLRLVSDKLPEGPKWFPEGMDSDATEEDLVSEFIREKVLLNCRDEVPHSVAVVCNDIVRKKDGHASVSATILVERDGQKGIIVGKGGSMIKKIGMTARPGHRASARRQGVPRAPRAGAAAVAPRSERDSPPRL